MFVPNIEAWFRERVAGDNPANYAPVIERLKRELWQLGLGFQTDSGGVPRGRLFLPHAGAPNCAPRNSAEEQLGVRQESACWELPVDIVNHPPTQWTWTVRSGLTYQPLETQTGGGSGGGSGPSQGSFDEALKDVEELVATVLANQAKGLELQQAQLDTLNAIRADIAKTSEELQTKLPDLLKLLLGTR